MVEIKGQEALMKQINNITYPHNFTILVGARGSGRHTVLQYLSKKLKMEVAMIGNKVDDIRDMIATSQSSALPRFYVIEDGDTMSVNAKNSLLKITEEAPRNCHIALLITTLQKTLPTLESRGQVLQLLPYSKEVISQHIENQLTKKNIKFNSELVEEYAELATNLGEVEELIKFDIEFVHEKVKFVYDNILNVSRSNALNIANFIQLKKNEEASKIPIIIFFKALMNYTSSQLTKPEVYENLDWADLDEYSNIIILSSEALHRLSNKSSSPSIEINTWILEVKK